MKPAIVARIARKAPAGSIFLTVAALTFTASARSAIAPIPESHQGALALQMIREYDGNGSPIPAKVLRVVYFTPADRNPVPGYEHRLEAILDDLRSFYRTEMERNGFGSKTFQLERDAQGRFVVHLVKGKQPARVYIAKWRDRRRLIGLECEQALAPSGIWFSNETVVIVCNLANWDPQTHRFMHPSPYTGTWNRRGGLCWLMDSPILNRDYLGRKELLVNDAQFGEVPMGRRNSMFIGSIGHELGHAFGMPHSGERWDEAPLGKSLMGTGNLQYRLPGKGVFLTMASAMRLAARPLFNGSDKGFGQVPRLRECRLSLSTNVTRIDLVGRPGAFRLDGTVKGTPPVYGVIAYFDSLHDGGHESPTATPVPDAQGRFALEISDLEPCKNGELFISFCHANGTTTGRLRKFAVPEIPRRERARAAARSALEAFRQLLRQHQVPGLEYKHGNGEASAQVSESLDWVEVTFKVDGNPRVYRFTMRQNPRTDTWEIQSAPQSSEMPRTNERPRT
jgi:hypothetical protein